MFWFKPLIFGANHIELYAPFMNQLSFFCCIGGKFIEKMKSKSGSNIFRWAGNLFIILYFGCCFRESDGVKVTYIF